MKNQARRTLSFYRYVKIDEPYQVKESLLGTWRQWEVLGRIYLSHEGINAQLSVPEDRMREFTSHVHSLFPQIAFKRALEESTASFRKLKIKVRDKIVADGLSDKSFDVSNVGKHLSTREFNQAMAEPGTIVVDMRNHYESEVGHFQGSYLPQASTFREALPEVTEYLRGHEDKKILLYCTGGIRCEKASAWLKHQGFQDVNQLEGGIIDYAHQIQQEEVPSLFRGMNFVFDDRLGEKVTADTLAGCHQCGSPWDLHSNCQNPGCNLLFLQCPNCALEFDSCCTYECRDISKLPREDQVRWQNDMESQSPKFLRSRRRLDLQAINASYLERKVAVANAAQETVMDGLEE